MEFQIRLSKVMPLEQQRRFGNRGNSIGEAVAHIERGGVATPTEPLESIFRRPIMFLVKRDGSDVGGVSKALYDLGRTGKAFARQDHPCFEQGRPADDDSLGSGLIDQSQKITVAARAMAERKTIGHLS